VQVKAQNSFDGDPTQIDNTDVNLSSNGLSTRVESFKGSQLAGHVRLRVLNAQL
jgi:predicted ribonuclease YlaK